MIANSEVRHATRATIGARAPASAQQVAKLLNATRQAQTLVAFFSGCADLFGGAAAFNMLVDQTKIDVASANDSLLASSTPIASAYAIDMQQNNIAFAFPGAVFNSDSNHILVKDGFFNLQPSEQTFVMLHE